MILTPGHLYETRNERGCAGEEYSEMLPFPPGWRERREAWVRRVWFPGHGPLPNTRLAAAELFLTCCAWDVPRHAAVKLFQCPTHSDTVSHPFICFLFLARFLGLEQSVSPLSFARPCLLVPPSGASVRTGCRWVCGAEQHAAALASSSMGTPGPHM